ncbi:four helix bundle protein [Marivirga arenosa]|uniref:Four helix bundle protein n=1 Tax=Marivirga arenosa TaxID=3059076 RepID=A0AA51ZXV4_9BACT|nr:four helix bundle protein [Marivirga sp. BKB1-2]WNB18722.1 four helix bundle protein [Marivirga sp. BKB1-2]
MSFKFEKLRIWQMSMDFAEEIYKISEAFPKTENYNLTSQIRRAVDSIALNIAEGSILQSLPENKKFLGYSIRSLAEVVTCLYKAEKRQYIDIKCFKNNYDQAYLLMNMMISYRSKIK